MDKKLVSREEDYSKWYNELVVKAGLAENSAVRGCMIIKPYGYAIWEKMQSQLDKMFKNTGHENAYFPLFVPKSLFEAEEKNAEGFAKECAIVTHYRLQNDPDNKGKLRVDPNAKLEEPFAILLNPCAIEFSPLARDGLPGGRPTFQPNTKRRSTYATGLSEPCTPFTSNRKGPLTRRPRKSLLPGRHFH